MSNFFLLFGLVFFVLGILIDDKLSLFVIAIMSWVFVIIIRQNAIMTMLGLLATYEKQRLEAEMERLKRTKHSKNGVRIND